MGTNVRAELDRFNAMEPIESARTPPASWYTEKAFLTLEKEAVFRKHWQIVGTQHELKNPGDYFSGNFMGWPYVVCLDDSAQLKAYYNVCSHHGTCVVKGEGNTQRFVCPYHGWTYDLGGKLKRAPRAGKMAALKERGLDLKTIPIATWGPFVALHFGEPQQTFTDQLDGLIRHLSRDPFEGMNFVKRVSYSIPCNWKVYVDNYLDGGYHVPHMHPGLSDQIDMGSYQTLLGELWSIQNCGGAPADANPTGADFQERLGQGADYAWLYPNFMFNRYGPWLDTNWVIPTGTDSCTTVFDYYVQGIPDEPFVTRSLAASHQVQLEDIAITEMVQTGLKSGVYQQGIYAPRFEMPMLHFHRLLHGDLEAGCRN